MKTSSPREMARTGESALRGVEKEWSREWELNPRPADYESAALPLSYLGLAGSAGARRTRTESSISNLAKDTSSRQWRRRQIFGLRDGLTMCSDCARYGFECDRNSTGLAMIRFNSWRCWRIWRVDSNNSLDERAMAR